MNYEDHDLQNHELDFWINSYTPPFFHFNFYNRDLGSAYDPAGPGAPSRAPVQNATHWGHAW